MIDIATARELSSRPLPPPSINWDEIVDKAIVAQTSIGLFFVMFDYKLDLEKFLVDNYKPQGYKVEVRNQGDSDWPLSIKLSWYRSEPNA